MKKINKGRFIEVCEKAISMSEAASELRMHFNTFKRYAIKWDCYMNCQKNPYACIGDELVK